MESLSIQKAVEDARTLLSLLPEKYVFSWDGLLESGRLASSSMQSMSLSEDPSSDFVDAVTKRIAVAWHLHREAAAEQALNVTATKQVESRTSAGDAPGIATLIMAASDEIRSQRRESSSAAAAKAVIEPTNLNKKRTFQDVYTESFFRGGSSVTDDSMPSYI